VVIVLSEGLPRGKIWSIRCLGDIRGAS